jgi:hypothetical protein|tara:strand:- start:286 stop:555 length:270 start_codon:yes stop_codon:yes gene_type:complete
LISFITPLQSYVPDEIVRILRKTHDALTNGGTCLVIDYILDDDKSGPLDPAFINLEGLRKGHSPVAFSPVPNTLRFSSRQVSRKCASSG